MTQENKINQTEMFHDTKNKLMNLFEKEFLQLRLSQYGGNVTSAARGSGMTRQNFQRLLSKHNVIAKEYRK